ncbi:MAG TPA: hypothetical protein VES59_02815 [Bacteroidota bacterium]|nr:hypothetical protein [Bacteroidota bacterium]
MKIVRFTLVVLLFVPNLLSAAGRSSITLIPIKGRPVMVLINGNEKEYYLLTPLEPIGVRIDGPGRLSVMSRLKLPKGNAEAQKYTILIKEGNNTVSAHTTQTDASDAVLRSSNDVLGKSRKFSLNVPEGSFSYKISLEDTPFDAVIKLLFQPSKGTNKLVAIEPLSYDRIVTATIAENLIAYYVSSKDRPVQFRAVGPTQVQISTRLNYDEKMKGAQKYSVVFREGKTIVAQRPLETTKSVGLSYQEWKEVVPGKVNSLLLEVPAGQHTYEVTLSETSAKSVSLRFSVPEKDLNNAR